MRQVKRTSRRRALGAAASVADRKPCGRWAIAGDANKLGLLWQGWRQAEMKAGKKKRKRKRGRERTGVMHREGLRVGNAGSGDVHPAHRACLQAGLPTQPAGC